MKTINPTWVIVWFTFLAIPLSGFGSLSKMLLFIFTQFILSLSFIPSLCLSFYQFYVSDSLSLPSICLSGCEFIRFFLLSATNYYNRSLSCGPMTTVAKGGGCVTSWAWAREELEPWGGGVVFGESLTSTARPFLPNYTISSASSNPAVKSV